MGSGGTADPKTPTPGWFCLIFRQACFMAFLSYLFGLRTPLWREPVARARRGLYGRVVAVLLTTALVGCEDSGGERRRVTLTGAVSLASGEVHTCVLRRDATVACWGSNLHGQLGVESNKEGFEVLDPIGLTTTASAKYYQYAQPIEGLTGVQQIAAGRLHSCALLKNRTVSCWGDSARGQIGNGDFSTDDCEGRPCSRRPVKVDGISDATALACGPFSSCAIHDDGRLSCWGSSALGVEPETLDRCDDHPCATRAVEVTSEPKAVKVALGSAHGCVIREDGSVACWGSNLYGQIGV